MFPFSRKCNLTVKNNAQSYVPGFLSEMDKSYPGNGLRNAKRIAETHINHMKMAVPSKLQSENEVKATLGFWRDVLGILNRE
jgi:hypothetical protein